MAIDLALLTTTMKLNRNKGFTLVKNSDWTKVWAKANATSGSTGAVQNGYLWQRGGNLLELGCQNVNVSVANSDSIILFVFETEWGGGITKGCGYGIPDTNTWNWLLNTDTLTNQGGFNVDSVTNSVNIQLQTPFALPYNNPITVKALGMRYVN